MKKFTSGCTPPAHVISAADVFYSGDPTIANTGNSGQWPDNSGNKYKYIDGDSIIDYGSACDHTHDMQGVRAEMASPSDIQLLKHAADSIAQTTIKTIEQLLGVSLKLKSHWVNIMECPQEIMIIFTSAEEKNFGELEGKLAMLNIREGGVAFNVMKDRKEVWHRKELPPYVTSRTPVWQQSYNILCSSNAADFKV